MKCDECLIAHESPYAWKRSAARRHAAGCPACARAIVAFDAMKRQLADAPPLASARRRLWLSAAGAEPATIAPTRRRLSVGVLSGAFAAVVILVAIGIWYGLRPRRPAEMASQQGPAISAPDETHLTIRTDPAIRQRLEQLSEQLDELSRQAALLDEQRQLRELMQKFP